MAIGFFTQGIEYKLPHPKISLRIVLILCKVIRTAWQLLEETPPAGFVRKSADEKIITQLLVEIIENRLRKNGDVDGFNCALFGKVIRDPKIANVDKMHPDKMPDIVFDLKRDQLPIFSDQDGLFVECKPVDRNHPILSCYCKKGLIRFVNGDYAWAMQDAMMVGYVKDNYSFKKLASILNHEDYSRILNTTFNSSGDDPTIYISSHNRYFKWPENNGQACPISVAHLWLSM
ncbi:hypothetical protein [uncultured Desulfosarcina sp.]|uniref:hypothetical protein n=1 Tax=uncultured Desulfosarcina sp. TaxID=218289 RepID=UPI0029C92C29|nr:hypothetical protein [uncultured Desulfosarcina sp.]